MSFEQYPERLKVRVLETNETANLGTFTMPDDKVQLGSMVLTLYKQGTEGGSEQLQLGVHTVGDTNLDAPMFLSEPVLWSSAGSFTNFLGTLRFDFIDGQLSPGVDYVLSLEMTNYTRNGDTFYFSYVLDDPAQVNDRVIATKTGAQIAIVGRVI